MTSLVQLPRRVVADASSAASSAVSAAANAVGDVVRIPLRPLLPSNSVDDWGRDDHLIQALSPYIRLRWAVTVGTHHHLPVHAGALLVTNQRRYSLSPMYVAWALGQAIGRPVRFVGRPDIAPVGAALRRLGGLLHDPAEVEGALRHGELVVLGTSPTNHPRHAGVVDHEIVGAAVMAGVHVFPVASMSARLGRSARADVGPMVRNRHNRRGPLAEVELSEAVQRSLQKMLDEFGGTYTGVAPIDWLGEG